MPRWRGPKSLVTARSAVPRASSRPVNEVVRTAQQMLPEIGREPTPEELSEKLAMPLDKVHRVLAIANRPIRLETPTESG
jgi:RNA polymerase primary sigma factor